MTLHSMFLAKKYKTFLKIKINKKTCADKRIHTQFMQKTAHCRTIQDCGRSFPILRHILQYLEIADSAASSTLDCLLTFRKSWLQIQNGDASSIFQSCQKSTYKSHQKSTTKSLRGLYPVGSPFSSNQSHSAIVACSQSWHGATSIGLARFRFPFPCPSGCNSSDESRVIIQRTPAMECYVARSYRLGGSMCSLGLFCPRSFRLI